MTGRRTAQWGRRSSKNGSHTGLKKVEIYVKTPTSGTYSLAHTFDPASGAGNFDYTAAAGDGSYDFYSIAYDNAGNVEAVPVGPDNITIVSQATTLLDTGKPTSTASVPDYENSNTFSASYTANEGVIRFDGPTRLFPSGAREFHRLKTDSSFLAGSPPSRRPDPPGQAPQPAVLQTDHHRA